MTYVHTTGYEVQEEDAFAFALEKCGLSVENDGAEDFEEFREYFVDWYFSDGQWTTTNTPTAAEDDDLPY